MNKTKYRLLKDLPVAKAGTIARESNGAILYDGEEGRVHVLYLKHEVEEFGILEPENGWFEKLEEPGEYRLRFDTSKNTLELEARLNDDDCARDFYTDIDEVCRKYWRS